MSINTLTVAFTATNNGTITAPNVVGTLTEPLNGISLVKVTTQKELITLQLRNGQ